MKTRETARRRRALDQLRRDDLHGKVTRALRDVWLAGGGPPVVPVRPEFVRRDEPYEPASDAHLPGRADRPPAARLVSPRGVSLRLYLTTLFDSTCRDRRVSASSIRPVRWAAGAPSLVDLVAAPADHDPASTLARTATDNRERQLKRALDRLHEPDVELVELPHAGSPSRRYEDAILLREHGVRDNRVDKVKYSRPRPNEGVIEVPADFFLNGWVHVLRDSDTVAYLMVRDMARRSGGVPVPVAGEVRVGYYGVPKEGHRGLRLLADLGVLAFEAAEGRRPDGTVEGFSDSDARPHRHQWSLADDGLGRDAVDAMSGLLAS